MSDDVSLGSSEWKSIRLQILERDRWTCQVCRTELRSGTRQNPGNAQVDHIIPRVNGGKTTFSNLRAICSKCNGIKSMVDAGTAALAKREPEPQCKYHGSQCGTVHSETGDELWDIMFK